MNYSIKILQDELNRINSAYERFVSKGTIETEHVLALANRTKARDLEQAITELNQALQLQQTGVMQRYFHPFVGAGTLIKETEKSLVIKLDFNGKEYFAPKHEFTELL